VLVLVLVRVRVRVCEPGWTQNESLGDEQWLSSLYVFLGNHATDSGAEQSRAISLTTTEPDFSLCNPLNSIDRREPKTRKGDRHTVADERRERGPSISKRTIRT